MSVTSSLKKQVDLPVWEWCRFAPIVSAAGSTLCSDESSGGRYIYYVGATCYRYDTWSDGWQMIATPPIALTGGIGPTRYTVYGGYRGKVLAATSNTLRIPGLQGNKLVGKTIRIYDGRGVGQERVITYISGATVHEFGIATTASVSAIVDAQTIPKKWKINQWSGYQCRLVFGTGQSQVRKILYNDHTGLTFTDTNWQSYDSWSNTGWASTAPYQLPVNAVTHYVIESRVITLDSAWTTVPDETSRFVVLSGAIWFLTQKTLATGAAAMQCYDILSDQWITKTCPGYLWPVLAQTDVSIERTGESGGMFCSGTCTASDTRSLTDSGASWTYDRYSNLQIRVTNPSTGTVMRHRITGNNNNRIWVDTAWEYTIPTGHTYSIYGDTNSIWVMGNSGSSMYKYLVEEDQWTPAQETDSGVVKNFAYAKTGQSYSFQATIAVVNTGVTSVLITASGTGYQIGDISYIGGGAGNTGGAKVRVTDVDTYSGVVKGIELWACGTGGTYTAGGGHATIALIGTGAGLTVHVQTVGPVGYGTSAIVTDFKKDDVIWGSGATVAAWNFTGATIIAKDSLLNFHVVAPNYVAPVANIVQATTAIVDASKNWTPGEHIGKTVLLTTVGVTPSIQIRKITGSTATTLFVVAVPTAAGVVGTSRYIINNLNDFGRDDQYKQQELDSSGWVFSGSTTSLTDTGKTWFPGQWNGYKVKIICGTGYDCGEIVITGNTSDSLIFTGTTFTADTTTKYRIMHSYGIATGTFAATTLADNTKTWRVNQWAGKSVRLYIGSLATPTFERTITSNTINTLTYATTTTVSDANTLYTILGTPIRNAGIQIMWNYGQTNTDVRGKYLYVPRGGTTVAAGWNLLDRYDINQDQWDYSILQNPAAERETLGSQWCYDGGDGIYWSPSGAQGTRLFYINLNTLTVDAAGIHPYANGVAVVGNRMEINSTADGLEYLYTLRVTGAEFFRTLLWWND